MSAVGLHCLAPVLTSRLSFYEQQGFTAGAAFRVDGKHGPGLPWQGRVLSKPVRQRE